MLIPKPQKKEPTPPPPMPPQKDEPGKLSYDNGIIMLTTKFDNEEIMPIVAKIIEYNLMEKPPAEITLYINSGGGEVDSCFHLIDIMKQSRIPVNTIAMGQACSCAFIALMAGAKRYATQNTTLMSHQWSWGSHGKAHELEARNKAFEMATDQMLTHYKKCTKKSEKYIRKHLLPASDVFMTAEEAVTHGVIDEVIQTY